jgi:hypothetical protein
VRSQLKRLYFDHNDHEQGNQGTEDKGQTQKGGNEIVHG